MVSHGTKINLPSRNVADFCKEIRCFPIQHSRPYLVQILVVDWLYCCKNWDKCTMNIMVFDPANLLKLNIHLRNLRKLILTFGIPECPSLIRPLIERIAHATKFQFRSTSWAIGCLSHFVSILAYWSQLLIFQLIQLNFAIFFFFIIQIYSVL